MATRLDYQITAQDRTAAAIASASRNLQSLGTRVTDVRNLMGGLGLALGPAMFTSWARGVIDGIDKLNDLSDATSSTIENISALEDVAARTGTSFETVSTAMVRFTKAMAEAKPGSEGADLFKRLGLSVDELRAKDPAQALLDVAKAFSTFADDQRKAEAFMLLFGKSIKEVAPLLKDLAEAGELNAKVTAEEAKQAEELNKQLMSLDKNVTDASRSIVSGMLPALNESIKAFVDARKAGKSFLDIFNENHDKGFSQMWRWLGNKATFGWISATPPEGGASGSWDTPENARARARLLRQGGGGLPSLGGGGGGSGGKDRVTEAERYTEQLQRQLDATRELTAHEQLMLDLGRGRLKDASWREKSELAALAIQVDAAKESKRAGDDALKKQQELVGIRERTMSQSVAYVAGLQNETDAMAGRNAQLQEQYDTLAMNVEQLGRYRVAALDAALAEAKLDLIGQQNIENNEAAVAVLDRKVSLLQQQRDLVRSITDKEVATAAQKAAAEVAAAEKRANEQRSESLADSIEQGILQGFRKGGNAAEIFRRELEAQFAKTVLRPVIKPLADTANDWLSSLTSAITSGIPIASSVRGGSAPVGIVQGFPSWDGGGYTGDGARMGGLDGKGGFLAMMHPRETVTDHTKGQRSAERVVIEQHITVGDVASKHDVRHMLRNSNAALVKELAHREHRRDWYTYA